MFQIPVKRLLEILSTNRNPLDFKEEINQLITKNTLFFIDTYFSQEIVKCLPTIINYFPGEFLQACKETNGEIYANSLRYYRLVYQIFHEWKKNKLNQESVNYLKKEVLNFIKDPQNYYNPKNLFLSRTQLLLCAIFWPLFSNKERNKLFLKILNHERNIEDFINIATLITYDFTFDTPAVPPFKNNSPEDIIEKFRFRLSNTLIKQIPTDKFYILTKKMCQALSSNIWWEQHNYAFTAFKMDLESKVVQEKFALLKLIFQKDADTIIHYLEKFSKPRKSNRDDIPYRLLCDDSFY